MKLCMRLPRVARQLHQRYMSDEVHKAQVGLAGCHWDRRRRGRGANLLNRARTLHLLTDSLSVLFLSLFHFIVLFRSFYKSIPSSLFHRLSLHVSACLFFSFSLFPFQTHNCHHICFNFPSRKTALPWGRRRPQLVKEGTPSLGRSCAK